MNKLELETTARATSTDYAYGHATAASDTRSSSAPPRVLEQRRLLGDNSNHLSHREIAHRTLEWGGAGCSSPASDLFFAPAFPHQALLGLPTLAARNEWDSDKERHQQHPWQGTRKDLRLSSRDSGALAEIEGWRKNMDTSSPGIGLVVEPHADADGHFVVASIAEGSAAALTARVHEGDVIEEIDGKSVKGCTSFQLKEWVASELRKGVVTLSLRKAARGMCWKEGDVLQVCSHTNALYISTQASQVLLTPHMACTHVKSVSCAGI